MFRKVMVRLGSQDCLTQYAVGISNTRAAT